MMDVFFVLDDQADVADASTTAALCSATKDAVVHPTKPRPDGEHVIGELTRQYARLFPRTLRVLTCGRFWNRARVSILQVTQERFVESWCAYVDSVAEQSSRREASHLHLLALLVLHRQLREGGAYR